MLLKVNMHDQAPDLFTFQDYKEFLKAFIASMPKGGRGVRQTIAKTAGCKSAYISHVLDGSAHFSLEQADAIAKHFSLSDLESRYFLMLVQLNRAGTISLKRHFKHEMERLLEDRNSIQKRTGVKQTLTMEDQATYYSSWIYGAIHVAVSIQSCNTIDTLQRRLGIDRNTVASAVDFLFRTGLVERNGTEFKMGSASIHLPNKSPLISKHHANWRNKALTQVEAAPDLGLHFSAVFTLSKQDVEKIRRSLMKQIDELVSTIRTSPSEEMMSMTLDFFSP